MAVTGKREERRQQHDRPPPAGTRQLRVSTRGVAEKGSRRVVKGAAKQQSAGPRGGGHFGCGFRGFQAKTKALSKTNKTQKPVARHSGASRSSAPRPALAVGRPPSRGRWRPEAARGRGAGTCARRRLGEVPRPRAPRLPPARRGVAVREREHVRAHLKARRRLREREVGASEARARDRARSAAPRRKRGW